MTPQAYSPPGNSASRTEASHACGAESSSPQELLEVSVVVPVVVAKVIRVRVSGEIDSSTVDLLVRAIEPHLDISDAVIVVDLTEVTFLGAAGLRALERAEHHANRVGSELCLVTATTAVQRSLAVLNMLRA